MSLMNGQTYILGVKEITPAADFFSPRDGGATRFCHYYDLVDEHGEVYPFQICDEKDIQSYCSIGDTIKIKVKTFTKGRYTTETIIVVSGGKPVAKEPEPALKFTPPTQDSYDGNKNPRPTYNIPPEVLQAIANKGNAAIALECAVKFYSNVPVANVNKPSDSIIDLAKEFHKFLQSQK